MPRLTRSVPKYRKHRASGQAVVTLDGKDHYLGPHGTKTSRLEYDRLVGEWQLNGRTLKADSTKPDITVVELLAAYIKFARTYYVKSGKPTRQYGLIVETARPIKELYGRELASNFGPLALQAIQQRMIEAGLSRRSINDHTARIKRLFKWGVAQELIPATSLHALQAVPGLRKGRSNARENSPVQPIEDRAVQATLPHLQIVVADMVRFQRLTGCRPQDVCNLRPCNVDMSSDVWLYRPPTHKTEHHGRERIIAIGPKGQGILRKYLLREKEVCCFSPLESEKQRREVQHEQRKTPLSCGNRPGTNQRKNPKRSASDKYTTNSYRRAIHRACDKAGIARWSPNRLRHSAGTEIRKRYGLEAAQVILGHATADVTQVYAERDLARAVEIMREVG